MTTDFIEPHAPLDASQLETLQRRTLKKHDTAVILLHWFNAGIWLVELCTGGALLAGTEFRIAPIWWREFMVGLLGSESMLLKVHVAAGVLWTSVLLVYGIFGFRKYLLRTVTRYLIPDRDDFRWVLNRGLLIAGRKDVSLPAQGIYNGGQKLYGLMVYGAGLTIVITGFIMAFRWGPDWLLRWAILVHFLAVGGTFAGLFVHVYMGAVLTEERPAFFSMFTGKVPELYAYRHHHKWWAEQKKLERIWHEDLQREVTEHRLNTPRKDASEPAEREGQADNEEASS